jgi:hypothetical protein
MADVCVGGSIAECASELPFGCGMGMFKPLHTRLDACLREICAACPDFLLPTVLEGMLMRVIQGESRAAVGQALSKLDGAAEPCSQGYALGLKALRGCAEEGSEAYFLRLKDMSAAEVAAFRRA